MIRYYEEVRDMVDLLKLVEAVSHGEEAAKYVRVIKLTETKYVYYRLFSLEEDQNNIIFLVPYHISELVPKDFLRWTFKTGNVTTVQTFDELRTHGVSYYPLINIKTPSELLDEFVERVTNEAEN